MRGKLVEMYKTPSERRRIRRTVELREQAQMLTDQEIQKSENELKIQRFHHAIGAIFVKKTNEMKPVEVLSRAGTLGVNIRRILTPNSITDDYFGKGNYYHIIEVTKGVILPDIMVSDTYFDGKMEKDIPESNSPILITQNGAIFSQVWENRYMDGWGVDADSLLKIDQIIDMPESRKGEKYFHTARFMKISEE